MLGDFRRRYDRAERRQQADAAVRQYPDRLPVIVERMSESSPAIDRGKFLVPSDLSVGQLVYVVRKRIRLPPHQAMFLLVCLEPTNATGLLATIMETAVKPNIMLPATGQGIADLHARCQWNDGFLYMAYSLENAFG